MQVSGRSKRHTKSLSSMTKAIMLDAKMVHLKAKQTQAVKEKLIAFPE